MPEQIMNKTTMPKNILNSRNSATKGGSKQEQMPEDDELLISNKLMSNDIQEIRDGIKFLNNRNGNFSEPFRKLYEAAQAKVKAHEEFEKAKNEIMKQIKSNKSSPRKSNTLSTSGTVYAGEFQRGELLIGKDGKRIVNVNINPNTNINVNKNFPSQQNLGIIRNRAISIFK